MGNADREFTLTVKQGLLGYDCLGLEWEPQLFLAPYAKHYVRIGDGDGNTVRCRVNARVTLLKGKGLIQFFNRLGMGEYTVKELGPGEFLVKRKISSPVSGAPEKTGKAHNNSTAAGPQENSAKGSGKAPKPAKTERKTKSAAKQKPGQKTGAQSKPLVAGKAVKKLQDGPENTRPKAGARREDPPDAGKKAAENKIPGIKAAGSNAAETKIPDRKIKGGKIPENKKPDPKDSAQEVKITFFPEDDIQILEKATTSPGKAVSLSDLFLRRQALGLSLSPGFNTLISLSAVRNVQPLEYQQKTVRHVLQHLRGRALLCDEVGLGKTIEAGLIMMEYLLRGLVRRVLVITPPSLVEQWREEMQAKFNLDFVTYDSSAFKARANPWDKFPRIIASLDTAKRENHRRNILQTEYDLVIVDEAHHLKNSRTQGYRLVSRLKKKYILLLTATPVENDLSELFNLITLLLPGQLETASSFKRRYVTRGDPLKVKNAGDLKRLVREVMVRNRRSETGAIISRRRAEIVEVTLSSAEMAFYNRLTTFVRGHYTPGTGRPTGGVNRFVLKMLQREAGSSLEALIPTLERMSANPDHPAPLRRVLGALAEQARGITDRSKAEALVRLLEQIPDKVVIFTGFRETQRFLAALLWERGFAVAELHGEMRRQEKEEQVRLFADSARVLVSTETGSEGRNLQFCRNLVNYDLPWNPMRIEQRIGRIHRLGQTRNVYIYNFSAAGTIESYILELLDAKINMFQLVVGELDMILGNLKEKQEFEDIVMDIWARSADEAELRHGMDEIGEQLVQAREHYRAVKELDDRLLGELLPDEQ